MLIGEQVQSGEDCHVFFGCCSPSTANASIEQLWRNQVPTHFDGDYDDTTNDQSAWPDERLVAECLNGSDQAWSILVDRYKALVFSVPIRFGLQPDAAREVFQEVWLSLLSELPAIRDPRALVGWLARTAWHKCMHWKRTANRHPASQTEPTFDTVVDPAILPTVWIEEIEQEQAMRDAIATLAPRCAKLIEMLFFELPAAPYEEVAAKLGLAIGSIGFIRRRCLDRLKAQLKKRGIG